MRVWSWTLWLSKHQLIVFHVHCCLGQCIRFMSWQQMLLVQKPSLEPHNKTHKKTLLHLTLTMYHFHNWIISSLIILVQYSNTKLAALGFMTGFNQDTGSPGVIMGGWNDINGIHVVTMHQWVQDLGQVFCQRAGKWEHETPRDRLHNCCTVTETIGRYISKSVLAQINST